MKPAAAPAPRESDLEWALMRAAYRRKPLNLVLTIVVALGGAPLFRWYFPSQAITAWLVALLAVQGVGLVEWAVFRSVPHRVDGLRRWQRVFLVQSTAGGLAWGLGPVLLVRGPMGAELALLVGTLLCVCAVGMTSVSEQRRAMEGFVAGALLPAALAAGVNGGALERLVGVVLAVGLALMIWVGRNFNQAMRESIDARLRLETMLDASFEGIVGVGADGRILDWNRRAVALFGHTADEARGQLLASVILPPDAQLPLPPSAQAPLARLETVGWHRAGRAFPIEIALASNQRGDGGYTAFIADASERKQAQELVLRNRSVEEKAKLARQLEQAHKLESVGRLAGGIAHDFNNLLTVILGHASLLREQPSRGPQKVEGLVEIQEAAERAAELTRQLLSFARKDAVAPRALNVNEVVAQSIHLLRSMVGEPIDLSWNPDPLLWPVWLDPAQLNQMLTNLCVNAREAIPSSGKIVLDTANVRNPEAHEGEFVRLRVRDSGSGMDEETLAHLFEPFFTTKGLETGSGLGLASVYGAVTRGGGFVSVSSEVGRGSVFELYFPRYVPAS